MAPEQSGKPNDYKERRVYDSEIIHSRHRRPDFSAKQIPAQRTKNSMKAHQHAVAFSVRLFEPPSPVDQIKH